MLAVLAPPSLNGLGQPAGLSSLRAWSAASPRRDRSGGFLMALRRPVSNDLLAVRVQPPVTRCARRLATTGGRPLGGDPLSPTAACKARKCNGPPPPGPRLWGDAAPRAPFCRFQRRPFWEDPSLQESPQRHEYLARHRHHANTPPPLATAPRALPEPATQRTLGLLPPPTPGHCRGHPASVPVP